MEKWCCSNLTTALDLDGPAGVAFEPFEDSGRSCPIIEHFDRAASRHPDRLALSDRSRTLTYRDACHHVHALAGRIDSVVPPERPIGILLPHDALFPVAALACIAAHRPYVPIDLKYPPARIEAIMREADVGAVIVDGKSEATRLVPAGVMTVEVNCPAMYAVPEEKTARDVDRPAVILYTSGSTGKPKGICNSQRAILQRVAEYTNACHVHAEDRFILLSSPGTIAGVREMFTALLNGASLHVTDPQQDGIHAVLGAMTERRITIAYAVPSLLRMMLRLPGAEKAFSSLRVLRIGGDITLDSDLALFRRVAPPSCHFFASFSSTETPAVFQWFVPPGWVPAGPRVPIGRPRPGVGFAVVGDDGQPVPDGEIGELVVRSRYLALGLWQEGGLVPGPFRADPSDPAVRILHTGDLVTLRSDGLWELFGRKDRQIKIRGLRIDMGEVEAALRSVPEAADAAVTARRAGEEILGLAAFVARSGSRDDARLMEKLRQALSARVPPYMHPAAIHLVDALPQLPGFKPDIAALERLDRQRQEEEKRRAPEQAPAAAGHAGDGRPDARIAGAVRHAWSTVVGLKSYEAGEAWADTGADSLKAIELWFYIEDRLGFKLPLDALDEDTTPAGLAAAIQHHLARADLKTRDEDANAPLVYLLPGIQSDDPSLVRFRAAFGKAIRFRTLDYPGWRQTVNDGREFDAIVDHVVSAICAGPERGPYCLAGYSFGGIVAFEAARRLTQSGHRVGFLGLLDARRWDLARADSVNQLEGAPGGLQRLPVNVVKSTVALCLRRRAYKPLGIIERSLMLHPTRVAFWFKRQLTKELRYQALRQWKPAALDVPTALFLSDEYWPGEPRDYGWRQVCSRLTEVHIGGTHATVIQSPQRENLCENFLRALTDSIAAPLAADDAFYAGMNLQAGAASSPAAPLQ